MTARLRLDWNGPALERRVQSAELDGVRKTTEAAANLARTSHTWRNRSGKLQASIQVFDVERTSDGARGEFGYDRPYGLFLEIGMRGRPGSHDLRRAGDRTYSKLAQYIRDAAGF